MSSTEDKSDLAKKPELARKEYDRSSGNLFDQGSKDDSSNFVAYGARLGYQVIEQQIKQGQKIAQEMTRYTAVGGDSLGSLPEMVERMGRFYTDMLSTYVEMFLPLANGVADNEAKPNTTDGGNVGLLSLEVVVEAKQPSRTSVQLRASCHDAKIGPLNNISKPGETIVAKLGSADGRTMVTIEVDRVMPVGTYTGVVVNGSDEPIGSLSLKLSSVE